jgi:3-hydroxyisobutyrate dehydrogenase-like beta-hydroxyacid dehydrogenase
MGICGQVRKRVGACHCRAMKKVGIVGLGNIGRAVAANLAEAGVEVTALRRPSAADFPRLVENPAELARTCDVIVTALASEEAMRAAYLGVDGLAAGARDGGVIIDMGTFPVALKREIAEALAHKGTAMLDCPVSGTPPVVRTRQAVLFVSGDPAVIERCRPVLDAITSKHRTVGPFGAGMAVKWAANLLVTINTFATAQAMLLGMRSGIEPKVLIEAIGTSFASSPVFNARAPMMAEGRYQPAPGPAHVFLKDLRYIESECRRLGVAAPLIEPTLAWYARLLEAGRGNDEAAAIYELLKEAALAAS